MTSTEVSSYKLPYNMGFIQRLTRRGFLHKGFPILDHAGGGWSVRNNLYWSQVKKAILHVSCEL